jgi:hypothetical protein
MQHPGRERDKEHRFELALGIELACRRTLGRAFRMPFASAGVHEERAGRDGKLSLEISARHSS